MLKSSMMRMGVQACAGGSSLQNITLRASVATATSAATANKQKVVVVGAGWAGYRVAQDLDKTKFDVEVVSPRNHFLFTPLLPSTAVGTLEFRCIQEPVRTIPDIHYYQAEVKEIDFGKNELVCNDAFEQHYSFKLPYDVLIVAPGSETNTFNIPGVLNNPNVFFLKQLEHSRAIRNKLIDCFEKASSPSLANNLAMKKELLTFVVVGGGPINIEFAAELYDFLKSDVARWYPDLFPLASVKIIEASGHLLNTFHSTIVNYVERLFASRNIDLMMTTTVTKIDDHTVFLNNNQSFKFGLMVWSTGIKQVPFVQALSPAKVAKFPNGRLKIDEHLHVLQPMTSTTAAPTTTATSTSSVSGTESPYTLLGAGKVFALGDCAGNALKPLPSLAQVASQQGKYLANLLNAHSLSELQHHNIPSSLSSTSSTTTAATTAVKLPVFQYQHLGTMAQVGQWKGVFDSSSIDQTPDGKAVSTIPPMKGILAFFLWRAAYWTKQVSLVNKILIPMFWFKSMIFGRDISRF